MLIRRFAYGAVAVSAMVLAMSGGADAQNNNNNKIVSPEKSTLLPQVCFYVETDLTGRYFCESGSRGVNEVDKPWRNLIKSVEVRDGASVVICNAFNREGDCQSIDRNVRELGPDLYNHVYSYRTSDE